MDKIIKVNKIYTFEDCIRDIGEPPICGCDKCQKNKTKVNIQPYRYNEYKRNGYPKFINHHTSSCRINYKWTEQQREKQIKTRKGKKYNLGCHYKLSDEAKRNHSLALKNKPKSKEHIENLKKSWKNKTEEEMNLFSNKLKQNHSDVSGSKNPCWKGGVTPLYNQIRNSNKYNDWRFQVFGRDNFTCQECGIRGVWLEVHHIKLFSDIIKEFNITTLDEALLCQELWNISNGVTLCKKCHDKTKGR